MPGAEKYYLLNEELKRFVVDLFNRQWQQLALEADRRFFTRHPTAITHVRTTATHGQNVKQKVRMQTFDPEAGTYANAETGMDFEARNAGSEIPHSGDGTLCACYAADGEFWISPITCE